ncbi:MAG: OmpH family outer membrane protein [Opitutaceae bacterium]|nr:OmpH family outer membrane protein [Opitutaceae bacterium]
MNNIIRNFITLASLGLAATALQAQPALKVVVVDMAKLYDTHFKTEEANAKFQEADRKATEQIEELNKQGQTMVDEYKELTDKAKSTLLNAEARTQAEQDAQRKLQQIQEKQNEVNTFRARTQQSLQQRIKTHRDLLLEEISKVVTDIAKRKGATLVIDKSGPSLFGISNVIYADPSYEITDEVQKEVNKDRPASAPVAPTTSPASAPAASPGNAQFNVPNVTTPPASKAKP